MPGCRQVIDALRHMRFVECANRLEFNQGAIADHRDGHMLANDDTVVARCCKIARPALPNLRAEALS